MASLFSRAVLRPLAPRLAPRASTTTTTTTTLLARRLLSDSTRDAISRAVASAPVVLFMKGTPETPQCGFSRATVQVLGVQGVDPAKFAAFNVLEDAELREGIKEFSDWPTIPQLYVDKEFVGGCDIVMGMHKDGQLAQLFEDKGVLAEVATKGGEEKQ
jgi:monothiol glutaredoxin